ncbi:hypothetical protein BpHYR1_021576 [Brachionus plicatilis]|uniref:Uncharacterized protein n=1 Tax=Brachionus plicatilis TaxID=10195 RepID=A0A3M7S716_BRAPC|nr:hypothetical protein BpHYR1_021576 [Brachionus plicatilis]
MICGLENYIACWEPIDPKSVDRSSKGAPSTEGTSLSAPASATDPIHDSRISIRLDNLLGAVISQGRGLCFRAPSVKAQILYVTDKRPR